MDRSGTLTKTLAAVGTVLAWFPIAATALTGIAGSLAWGMFRLDYLMPAELFPAAFAGGLFLLWAALRARARRGQIGWGLAAMLALLAGGQVVALLTGLASGETEPEGWRWILVLASLAGYTLSVIAVAFAGTLLVRDLFKKDRSGRGAVLPNA